MRHVALPGFSKSVSALALGTLSLTPEPEEDYQKWAGLLDHWVSLGGNAIDTAFIYNGGRSELCLGRWFRERGNREQIFLIDKGAHPNREQPRRVAPEFIESDLQTSLTRLGIPNIDLYLLHRDDPEVLVAVILECLNRLVDHGKVEAYGVSNWTIERIDAANEYAVKHDLRPLRANSPNVSLARAAEPLWSGCITLDVDGRAWHSTRAFPVFAWSSQARGFFSGRYSSEHVDDPLIARVYNTPDNWERLQRVRQLAAGKETTPTRVALAWVLGEPYPIVPIIGPLRLEELNDSVEALSLSLSTRERAWLNLEV
ncbi:MAG: aldo/keto reductase [Chloroflexi bacterium]|nr:aldo/keto reductase [Chloroflexota bacterium]